MSRKHLAKGDAQPPKVDGKLRLYSMEFCPYAERARLVLLAKNVPHDIVNVHLKNKPDWIFDLHPEGKVPALDTGSQVVIESLDICNFLDEHYPEPPLNSKDPQQHKQDETLMKNFDDLIFLYYMAAQNPENRPFSEHIQKILLHVEKLENELAKRGEYFGGEQPSMVDYMLWPWGERAPLVGLVYGQELPGPSQFPHLYAWCKAMRTHKPVQETFTSPERLYKLNQQYIIGSSAVDYDSI